MQVQIGIQKATVLKIKRVIHVMRKTWFQGIADPNIYTLLMVGITGHNNLAILFTCII